ncbi:MAG: hypothetical protein E7252_00010 [Lachnospira sp.]|nr:hypothetical protein [Lachnospira sp.]
MNIDKFKEMKNRIEEVVRILLRDDRENINKVDQLIKDMAPLLSDMVTHLLQLKQNGVDIPIEIVMTQMENLKNSYANKDMVLLADVLQYEIGDTIDFYIEILKEIG